MPEGVNGLMPEILEFVQQAVDSGKVFSFVNDPRSQFRVVGPDGQIQTYLGATFLPLVSQDSNLFVDEGFEWLSLIGTDGDLFSRVPLRSAARHRAQGVSLATNDSGAQLTPKDYDTLKRLVRLGKLEGANRVIQTLLLVGAIRPLNDIIEKQRWQAIVDAKVVRAGDNDYYEEVDYTNIPGHRVNTGQQWYDPDYDPILDIQAMADKMGSVTNIIVRRRLVSVLTSHPKMRMRSGSVVLDGTSLRNIPGRSNLSELNQILTLDGLPPLQIYESYFHNLQGERIPFLRDTAFVMLNTSAIDPENISVDPDLITPTSLGYVGNGTPAGQDRPGRVAFLHTILNTKAPGMWVEGTQVTLPVVRTSEDNHRVGVLNVPYKI